MPKSSLRVEFETEGDFRREYASNIANGGIFVATRDYFEVRDLVRLELFLAYCGRSFEFDAEVVHCIPPEMAGTGATPGVALQLQKELDDLRAELDGLVDSATESAASPGGRAALRAPARLPVELQLPDGSSVAGRTRNLSSSGMLLALPGHFLPVGAVVAVNIKHPAGEEEFAVDATVVRHVPSDAEEIGALGVAFNVAESERSGAREFAGRVRATEHSRQLAKITGPIAALGVECLLRMFASTAREGTLTLMQDEREGFVVLENGLFRAAELAGSAGFEALAALLAWRSGRFEYETDVAPGLPEQAPVSLDVALWEARRAAAAAPGVGGGAADRDPDGSGAEDFGVDDVAFAGEGDLDFEVDIDLERASQRGSEEPEQSQPTDPLEWFTDLSRLSPQATLSVNQAAVDAAQGELDKIEQALVDLASVGMSVGKVVEVIPEADHEVYRALRGLADRGLVRFET